MCSARERVMFFSIAIFSVYFSLHSLRACRRSRCSFAPQHTHTHTHTHTHGPRSCTRNGSVAEANHAQFTHRMKRKRKKKAETARQEREKEKDTRLHACCCSKKRGGAKSAVVPKNEKGKEAAASVVLSLSHEGKGGDLLHLQLVSSRA